MKYFWGIWMPVWIVASLYLMLVAPRDRLEKEPKPGKTIAVADSLMTDSLAVDSLGVK